MNCVKDELISVPDLDPLCWIRHTPCNTYNLWAFRRPGFRYGCLFPDHGTCTESQKNGGCQHYRHGTGPVIGRCQVKLPRRKLSGCSPVPPSRPHHHPPLPSLPFVGHQRTFQVPPRGFLFIICVIAKYASENPPRIANR